LEANFDWTHFGQSLSIAAVQAEAVEITESNGYSGCAQNDRDAG
jgi:hypothetical protein